LKFILINYIFKFKYYIRINIITFIINKKWKLEQ
jgi:hypothetical protein